LFFLFKNRNEKYIRIAKLNQWNSKI